MSAFLGIDAVVLFIVFGRDLFTETVGLSVCAFRDFSASWRTEGRLLDWAIE
jgi:hypothetical protein